MVIETHDPEETFEVGRTIGMNAKPGQIYTLTGDLGVGKPCSHREWQQVLELQNL